MREKGKNFQGLPGKLREKFETTFAADKANPKAGSAGIEFLFRLFSICELPLFRLQSPSHSTHVLLEKIDTVLDINFLLVHHERVFHRSNQHHRDLTMHNVGEDGGREFHGKDDKEQGGEL